MADEKKQVTLTPAKVKGLAYAGQTVQFPVIGEVTFSQDGTVDVDEDKVEAFVAKTFDSFGFYEKGASKPDALKQNQNEQYAELKEQLDALETEDLLLLAKESGLPPDNIAQMTDGRIRKVLLEKMIEAGATQVDLPQSEQEEAVVKDQTSPGYRSGQQQEDDDNEQEQQEKE